MLSILTLFARCTGQFRLAMMFCLLTLAGCQWLPGKPPASGETSTTQTHAEQPGTVPASEQADHAARAMAFEQQQQFLPALDEWLAQTPLLMDDADLRANSRNVWRVLSQMRNEEFAQLLRREHAQLLDGWVALARIQRLGPSDLEKQAEQLQDWQRTWPLHPANRYLPEDMKLLRRLKEDQPRHIALMLPLSGKRANAGQAVRDGFLAAYYRSLGQGGLAIRIDFIDTESSPDLLSLYGAAVAEGAQLVIGPLEREQVQVLANEKTLAVPVLALNDLPIAATASTFYQFSLNPEEEARQAAIAARAAGLQKALVITGSPERYQRLAQRFTQQWQAMGGSVTATAEYHPQQGDFNQVVGQALGNPDPTSHSPRREDIDMIFLVGKTSEASQVLPALALHNASDLPVYALSQVYNPQESLRGNDLDGVHVGLTPWQAGTAPLAADIQRHSPPAAGLESLYAMGADAQQLYLRLALMQANPNLTLNGNTGYLRMDPQRRIERGLSWHILQNGRPAPLPDMVP